MARSADSVGQNPDGGASFCSAQFDRTIGALRDARAEALGDGYRSVLRAYRRIVASGEVPKESWRQLAYDGLAYLGGQSDRSTASLADYDHLTFGPFLAVSNEGRGAPTIRAAARATPKGVALAAGSTPLTLGVAIDGERLGGIGEVPVGRDEFAQIWFESVERLLMTTNVGSRANLRYYRRAPVVAVSAGGATTSLSKAKAELASAVEPFLKAPGGSRPITVFLDVSSVDRPLAEQVAILKALESSLTEGGRSASPLLQLGLYVAITGDEAGQAMALAGVELADRAGLRRIAVDGVVRKEADAAISLPGLLQYFPPPHLSALLDAANRRGIAIESVNQVDADTVAREVWSCLNTARAMGFDLGKYSLYPLTLEQSEEVVSQVQPWLADWSAAPVFYVDQGIVSRDGVYVGSSVVAGVEAWLRMVARHKVRLILIDTVDKSLGWKLVKSNGDAKGLLAIEEIERLNKLGMALGVKIMWAGGIEPDHAYQLGKLGVFGIYVTTAVCDPAPVETDYYRRDPSLAASKNPDLQKIADVKTLLEAGFFVSSTVRLPQDVRREIEQARMDTTALASILPGAWRALWSSPSE